jgi:glycosyltransferase involved in cell wall biosynthesis
MGDVAGNDGDAGSGSTFTFTVFTPTLDRAHTLERVYGSLVSQTFRDFEWIVVDDGSTDETEALVRAWQKSADFPIHYLVQDHRGKHVATNRAVHAARGQLFLTIDSDDSFVPHALERFKYHWDLIPAEQRYRFAAVTALTEDEHGILIGTQFPRSPTDSNALEIRFRYKVRGEKWGFQRTDVMRAHPFPEIEGYTGVVPESIVWNAIARRYKERYVNEVLRVYWQDQPSRLSGSDRRWESAQGAILAHESLLQDDIAWFTYAPLFFVMEAARYSRISFHAGRSAAQQFRSLHAWPARVLWALALPIGWAAFAAEANGLRR